MALKKAFFFVCVLVLHSTLLEATRFQMFPQVLESLATREFRKVVSPPFVRSLRTSFRALDSKDEALQRQNQPTRSLFSEKETHVGVHAMPPPFSQKSLNEKISECRLSSYVRSPHFYAYPLGKGSLDSIFSDPLLCESFVRALTQIPALHTISAVEAPSTTSLSSEEYFYFKGKTEKNTTVYINFMNRSVSRGYVWSACSVIHETQKKIFEFRDHPQEIKDQKAFYVYVTLIDSDWEKPFRLAETYDNDPYFASHYFPKTRSGKERRIIYFIPAFSKKKYPSLQDPTYWSHASSQEKWIYFLRHGFMHLDVPPALRDTPFEKVFERLDLKTWSFEKIRDHLENVLRQRNGFCYASDALERGQEQRKKLLSSEHSPIWPENYSEKMEYVLSAGIDFYNHLRDEESPPKISSSSGFPVVPYFQDVFFQEKLNFMRYLASFWHGFYHPEKEYEKC